MAQLATFSTLPIGLILAVALSAPLVAKTKAEQLDAVDLTNFELGPRHAQWLAGPIARIATEQERTAYLALTDDAAAERFVEAFWKRRGPNRTLPPSGPKHTFDERAEEADRRFSEAATLGRSSDRGTIFVVYGPPTTIEYASSPTPGGEPIEIWNYTKRSAPGLDGKRPESRYGFRKQSDVTEFFSLSAARRLRRTPTLGRRPPGS